MRQATETAYQYLVERPHPWRKQFCIKGRGGLKVWDVLVVMWANQQTPEAAAADRGLPAEAVYECLDYYDRNKELLLAEAEEEKRRLKETGWQFD